MDCVAENLERWCERRSLATPAFKVEDKRRLKIFFNKIDDDGSGEVSISELLDPMVSSGMFKSSQDVIRLLSRLDRNGSGGIDFKEFLTAVTSQNFGDKSKLKIMVECTSDPLDFDMDTMLCAERRKRLLAYVTQRATRHLTENERINADLVCNNNVNALAVLVSKQKKKYGPKPFV